MQRGGFLWALAGLSMLPMLLGRGKEDVTQNHMPEDYPIMQKGGLPIPLALMSKGVALVKKIDIPPALDALGSIGDYHRRNTILSL